MIKINHKICLSIIVIIIGYLVLKKILINEKNIERFETTELKELKEYKKNGLKEIADELNVKYKKDISIMELYYKIKLKLNDKKWSKIEKSRRQKELLESKKEQDIREKQETDDMKEYKKSLDDFIEYQNKQNNKIDLYEIGKDVEGGINELINSFNKLMSSDKEGFSDINTKKKYQMELDRLDKKRIQYLELLKKIPKNKEKSKLYIENKKKYNEINKKYIYLEKNNPYTLKKKTNKEEEQNNDNDDDDDEIDDNILDFLKYIFKEIYNISLKKINIFDNSNNDILKFFKNDVFKNDNTLIGGGVLLIIISMGLYFIDLSL